MKKTLRILALLALAAALVAGGLKIRARRAERLAALPPPLPAPWALHVAEIRRGALSRGFPALDARAMGCAEVDLDALPFGLPSGARVPARVILEQVNDALTVPQEALVRTGGGKHYVFALDEGGHGAHLRRVSVTPLLDGGSAVAVDGDLKPGDRVVVAHRGVLLRLRNGDPTIAEGVAR